MFESRVVRSWIFDDRVKLCYGCECLARRADLRIVRRATAHTVLRKAVTWLILPVVICLSQRLSHACLSISVLIRRNCEWLIKSVLVYLMVSYHLDTRGNSRANTCVDARLLRKGCILLDSKPIGISVPFRTIHSNCLERTAFAPAPDHSRFCPINFRW